MRAKSLRGPSRRDEGYRIPYCWCKRPAKLISAYPCGDDWGITTGCCSLDEGMYESAAAALAYAKGLADAIWEHYDRPIMSGPPGESRPRRPSIWNDGSSGEGS